MEYKDTLLMPKTDFPMRGNLPKREPALQTEWDEKIFMKKSKNVRKEDLSSFYMMDRRTRMVISIWGMR